MNLNFKRSASFLLALVMVFSLIPGFGVHAHAEDGVEEPTAQYTVKFLDEDGTELQSLLVDEGAMPEYTGEALYKEGYAFACWTPELAEVTADAEYTAVYTAVAAVSEEPEVPSEEPEAPSEEPEAPSEEPEAPEEPVVTQYKVSFLNYDGTVLEEVTVEEGKTPVYGGEIPVKAEDETNTYAFSGWTPELAAAMADAVYTAVFTATAKTPAEPDPSEEPEPSEETEPPKEPEVNQYTITFMDWDGTVLEEVTVNEGEIPVYSGEEPVRPEDETYVYKFAGWDSDYDFEYNPDVDIILPATEDKIYLAAYLYAYNPNAIMTAATLSGVSGLTFTGTNLNTGKASFSAKASGKNSIQAVATGVNIVIKKSTGKGKVTFTNSLATKATLSFDCTISGNLGNMVSTGLTTLNSSKVSEHYDISLNAGASVEFTITGADGGQIIANFTNIKLQADTGATVKTTFDVPAFGSYTVNDGTTTHTVSAGGSALELNKAPSTIYNLTAVPGTGYKLVGWYDVTNNKYLSIENSITKTVDVATTIKPIIASNDTAVYGVGKVSATGTYKDVTEGLGGVIGASMATTATYYTVTTSQYFTDLKEAVNYAKTTDNKYIVLTSSGVLPAGEYEIPTGITLLIPFDDAYTLYTTTPCSTPSYVQPTAHRTLTMESGANLAINGTLSVSGKHLRGAVATSGSAPSGPQGFIQMASNSNIIVNGNLYAYGYITGSGNVIAQSGATVYELFQIHDFRGGTQTTTEMLNNPQKVFFFNQYYVQNIEVPLTIHAGATEFGFTTIYMSSASIASPVAFIGGSGNMFTLTNGYVTKEYDGSKDRLVMNTSGNVSLSPIEMTFAGETITTSNYVLPINNNITVNVNSGTITLAQDVALLPGTEINVSANATCKLASGTNVYVYDAAEWGDYCYGSTTQNVTTTQKNTPFLPIVYAPSKTYDRTAANLTDARIVVAGTLDATEGSFYTTNGGAAITGRDGAEVKIKPGTAANTYQILMNLSNFTAYQDTEKYIIENADKDVYVKIPVTSAKLQHGDGTYLTTAEPAGTTTAYNYCGKHSKWYTGECDGCNVKHTVSFDADGGTGTMAPVTVKNGEKYILPACSFTKTGYEFGGWLVNGSSKLVGETITVTADTAVKAVWIAKKYTVTWMNGTTELYNEEVAYNNKPNFKEETPTKASDDTNHYTFAGWATTENGTAVIELPAITDKTTFYATYTATAHTWNSGTVTTQPTCTAEGVKTYTCTADGCGKTKTEAIAKKDHTYALTGYTWSADGKTCTANAKCSGCTATTTATGSITSAVKTSATCTVKGTTTYTATFAATWATTQTKDVQDIPVADHSFTTKASTTVHTAGNCQTETLYKAQCDNCPAISDTVTVKGQKVAAEHTSSEIVYKNITDETHDEYHKCCNTLIDDLVEHTYTDGACACGKEEPAKGMKGDVDVDNDVDMNDAVALLQYVLKDLDITDPVALANAEVTNDEALTMNDAVKIMQYVLKDIDSLD